MAQMDNLDLTKLLNELKDQAERKMAEMIGAKLYKSETGFTQDQLYTYCGREDCVSTLKNRWDRFLILRTARLPTYRKAS